MDYRTETFARKFKEAAKLLSATPETIVSLKFRENIGSHQEYRELIDHLEQESDFKSTPLPNADLQGNAYLLGKDGAKLLVVEHETGLEIIGIIGSVASVIG